MTIVPVLTVFGITECSCGVWRVHPLSGFLPADVHEFQYWKVHPHGSADWHRDAWGLTGVRKLRRSASGHDDRITFGKQTDQSVDVNPDV